MEQLNSMNGKEKRQRFSLRALIFTAVASVVLTATVLCGAAWMLVGPEGLSLAETMALINLRFVGEYDPKQAMDAAAQELIEALGDRWSYYIDAEGYQQQKQSRDNSYVGIGVTVSYEDERGLLVLSVLEGGPADKAGILPGEVITAVDGQSLAGEARLEGAEHILGERGTNVTLEITDAQGAVRTLTVKRDRVEEEPVRYELLEGGVGLITMKNFFSRSNQGMRAAVEELRSQGAVALIFDVRNNPGGYLDELTPMLDYLLPEGPIFRSRDRAGRERVVLSDDQWVDLPMAVIVNEHSYSAAEFFAAQLRETVGAAVVGGQTSGKGYSQESFPLFTGGSVSISTRAYLTGGGISLVGTGLNPKPNVELTQEQELLRLQGKLEQSEDLQLQAALAAVSKSVP